MKWVRFEHDGSPRFGILQNGSITVTSLSWKEILEGRAVDSLGVIEASGATLLAPLDRPGKIIADSEDSILARRCNGIKNLRPSGNEDSKALGSNFIWINVFSFPV